MKVVKQKSKEKFYDGSDICKLNTVYRIVIGARSNGKTYFAIRRAITKFFKDGKPSTYVRRYDIEIKGVNLNKLLAPHMDYVFKLSNGAYNDFEYKNNTFKFIFRNTNGDVNKRSDDFLYTVALNNWERSKGTDRAPSGLSLLIFDEFMTRGAYLTNEFASFANVISSFIRNRPGCEIWMLANTVAQFGCPYPEEMGLHDLETMKKGEIRLYTYNNKKLTVAVEYCAESEAIAAVEHYYAFDSPQLSILTTGDWETESYPHWHKEEYGILEKENLRFKVLLDFNNHKAIGEVYKVNHGHILFWHKYGNSNKEFTDKDIIYTDKPVRSYYHSNTFNVKRTKKQALIFSLMATKRDYYSDNTTGELIRSFILNK